MPKTKEKTEEITPAKIEFFYDNFIQAVSTHTSGKKSVFRVFLMEIDGDYINEDKDIVLVTRSGKEFLIYTNQDKTEAKRILSELDEIYKQRP